MTSPFKRQEGGNHYLGYRIDPLEFAMANDLNFCQGNVVKYVVRYKNKGGRDDLLKAKHYIELLLELEYGTQNGEGHELRLGHKDQQSVRVPSPPEVRPFEGFFWGVPEDTCEGV